MIKNIFNQEYKLKKNILKKRKTNPNKILKANSTSSEIVISRKLHSLGTEAKVFWIHQQHQAEGPFRACLITFLLHTSSRVFHWISHASVLQLTPSTYNHKYLNFTFHSIHHILFNSALQVLLWLLRYLSHPRFCKLFSSPFANCVAFHFDFKPRRFRITNDDIKESWLSKDNQITRWRGWT